MRGKFVSCQNFVFCFSCDLYCLFVIPVLGRVFFFFSFSIVYCLPLCSPGSFHVSWLAWLGLNLLEKSGNSFSLNLEIWDSLIPCSQYDKHWQSPIFQLSFLIIQIGIIQEKLQHRRPPFWCIVQKDMAASKTTSSFQRTWETYHTNGRRFLSTATPVL